MLSNFSVELLKAITMEDTFMSSVLPKEQRMRLPGFSPSACVYLFSICQFIHKIMVVPD